MEKKGHRHQCVASRPQWCLLFSILTISATAQAFNYSDALTKSLLYFESQRSGRLPYNQRVTWRDHSGLTDGLEQGVDLVGGYYDAGDHVKFGLPMAFTVTMLSWSVIEFREQIAGAGELEHSLEAIKWGTDYFIKAHTSPNVLWAEVGDGDTDHYCWQRPEDMSTSRRAYRIDENKPGSDLAGETAAAMAAASIVFRKTNPHYSHLLLHHAQELFEFGDKYRGKYDGSVGVVKSYYASVSGYMDELLWAALWLYKATDKEAYFKYVINKARCFGGIGWSINEFSWDVKYAGVQILASKDCVGAIDGTHIDAYVPMDEQIPYRGKKVVPTQNVMCACSFDMRFTYVMAGWEGTANDSRVFLECVTNSENGFPLPPRGKYYLVDSGYTNMPGFLSPFRGERYHLRDYRGRGRHPQDASELFNYTHSSLRNVIERCFGVLKARFPILKQMPRYSLRMQRYIVIACCVVHNFIRINARRDSMFEEFGIDEIELEASDAEGDNNTSQGTVEINVTQRELRHMAQVRESIARSMWEANQ